MTVLSQSNGTQFVIQAYRERLIGNKRNQLVRKIKTLSEQHGQYLQILKREGQLEVVFSNEVGCLLGETVWQHYNQPKNLIFCEPLADSDQLLLIVVRDGEVYLDTLISADRLQAELTPLMTDQRLYYIVASKAVPLSERESEDDSSFAFPLDQVLHFEALSEPLLPQLPALSQYQLQPISLALRSKYLGYNPVVLVSVVAVVLVVGLIAWWSEQTPPPVRTIQAPVQAVQNPYADYYAALTSPAPDRQLTELIEEVETLLVVPGWEAETIQFNHHQFVASLKADGGDVASLEAWAKQHELQTNITEQGVELNTRLALANRVRPTKIYHTQQVLTDIIDDLDQLLQKNSVSVGAVTEHGAAKETPITVTLQGASPEVMSLVAKQLDDLPLTLGAVNLHLNGGLIDGTIQLSVWGS